MGRTLDIGAEGERAAAEWLQAHGFDIMDVNWRAGRYEIDIVAEKNGTVHFIEVKRRKIDGLTTPEQAMTSAKVRALLIAINHYVESHGIEAECRIDFVAVDSYPDGRVGVRYVPDAIPMRW